MKRTLSRERQEFMKMTCVNRLNYNYYYFAFDVVCQSNYKMLKKREGREEMREKQGVWSYKIEFMLVGKSCLKSTVLNVLLQITFS